MEGHMEEHGPLYTSVSFVMFQCGWVGGGGGWWVVVVVVVVVRRPSSWLLLCCFWCGVSGLLLCYVASLLLLFLLVFLFFAFVLLLFFIVLLLLLLFLFLGPVVQGSGFCFAFCVASVLSVLHVSGECLFCFSLCFRVLAFFVVGFFVCHVFKNLHVLWLFGVFRLRL